MNLERDSLRGAAVDLPIDLQREVLALEARLDELTHYEVLGIRWGEGADAARAAYVERAKRFHPDRYGGRQLGDFRARLDRIMRRVNAARDVLSDDALRAEYEEKTAPPEEKARREARRIEDELRAEERRARLGRRNPIVLRAARIADLVRRGKEALEAGRAAQAAADLATAAALDPRHPEATALAAEARRRALVEKASTRYEQGLRHRAASQDFAALESFLAAAELAPGVPHFGTAASRAALKLGRAEQARSLAEAAVRAGPRLALAHLALGAACSATGDRGGAREALQRALELDPKLDEAKVLLKKLRWSLFR
jgi:curved DNA-binding protein CbpA